MHSWRKALAYGFLVWLIPFALAMGIYPIRQNDRVLFESIMPVAVVAATVVFTVLYLRAVAARQAREGVRLGLLWFVLCVVIDQFFFTVGPMAMTPIDYLKDIGLTYVMIPCITIGHGIMLQRARAD